MHIHASRDTTRNFCIGGKIHYGIFVQRQAANSQIMRTIQDMRMT